jgi:alpha-tubulin suppressor-like RCC1 family protein
MDNGGGPGNGTEGFSNTPVIVSGVAPAVAVALGSDHGCVLRSDGRVLCWGNNEVGQVGDGTFQNRLSPVLVSGLVGAVSIDGGDSHTCAVLEDGTVTCWGTDGLGVGRTVSSPVPVPVPELEGVVKVAASEHTCALRQDGSIWCWGPNSFGQLGAGTMASSAFPPVRVLGP